MILLGLGANLPGPFGPPRATLEAALILLAQRGIGILARSRWYRTAPVPVSDQPWFVNGVARLDTNLSPRELLTRLQAIEAELGRLRGAKNAPRAIDLDILAYDDIVSEQTPLLPHPRLAQRAFVLLPLRELAPAWRHPATGQNIATMIALLPPGQESYPME